MNELIPTHYQREAWNTLNAGIPNDDGTPKYDSLPHHDNLLTAEQAEKINQTFSVEAYLGTHGIIGSDADRIPTQKDYEAAKEVVDTMGPHDVLFVENYGYTKHTLEAEDTEEPGVRKQNLEQQRQDYGLDAWAYAEQLAHLKGNRVLHADADAFTSEQMKASEKVSMDDSSSLADELEYRARVNKVRERANANVVKDYALEHIDDYPDLPDGVRPRLIILFGSKHYAGLLEQYNNLGINVKFTLLNGSTRYQRQQEQASRLSQAVPALGSAAVDGAYKGISLGKTGGIADRLKQRRKPGYEKDPGDGTTKQ